MRPLRICALIEPQRRHHSCLNYTCHIIYRSAQCRARLCTALLQNSVEHALDELEWFRQSVHKNDEYNRRIQQLSPEFRIDAVLSDIEKWYFGGRAKERLSLSEPWLWYAKARSMRRHFVFHHGPTNSGKTYRSLDALAAAPSGVYCAPLKALATQVFHDMQNRGIPCDLLIGDERKFGGNAEHVACTVEMTPIDLQIDVGVIDEVQLIGDRDRGWAWTRSLLGLPAKEIHLCGEPRALPLIKKLLNLTGELPRLRCVEHRRLVPLALSTPLQGQLSRVENGDCLVCFSKKSVVESYNRLKSLPGVCPHLVYGALPFRVRERQSEAFNNGVVSGAQEKHVLVATDAIAYGLNMNIRRVVLTGVRKFDGQRMVELPHATTLQIIGRAGRFAQAFSQQGFATTMHARDFEHLQRCFEQPLQSLPSAGILPTVEIVLLQAKILELQGQIEGLHSILTSLLSAMRTSSNFFVCDMTRTLLRVAGAVDSVAGLTLRDKVIFSFVPLSDSSERTLEMLRKYASHHAKGERVPLYVNEATPDHEWVYKMCETYCWLGWRFRQTFCHTSDGEALKEFVSRVIGDSIQGEV